MAINKRIPATTIDIINRAKLPTVDQSTRPKAARKTNNTNMDNRQPPNPPFDSDINYNFRNSD